jgi:hypothetical protein
VLDEEGFASVSVAIIDQLREPLYFIGLPILFIWILRSPIEFTVMVEVVEFIKYELINEDWVVVTDVLDEKTKSFGKYNIIIRLMEELMLIEDVVYTTVMLVWAAKIGLLFVIAKGWLFIARLKGVDPDPIV